LRKFGLCGIYPLTRRYMLLRNMEMRYWNTIK
ncbi:TPA: VOC family protein, partial [Vibrio vulnificus]|nr:VOC family protein [Vibrio vulnificus]